MIQTDISTANMDIWFKDNESGDDVNIPDCPICHGAGFVHPMSLSGETDFTRIVPCECAKEEVQKNRLSQLQKYSNLGVLMSLTFDSLLPDGRQRKGKTQYIFRSTYETAKIYASDPRGWLIIIGPNGCGKTHLSCAIANYRINAGYPAFYIGVADLMDHLRSTFHPDTNIAYDDLFERIKNTPLLILDDLTPFAATSWAKTKLEQLLNHRFNTRLPIVITSYVSIEKLDENLQGHLTDPDFSKICHIQPSFLSDLGNFEGLELRLIKEMSFENFDSRRLDLPVEQQENLTQAYKIALDFARSPQGWLVLQGENGCGKTHLAAAIANYIKGVSSGSVLFIIVPDLLDHLRAAFSPESKVSYDELFEKVRTAPVLVLDDFGEQAATPWAKEKLYQVINYRYNARLATVITMCSDLEEIETRISSRMVDPSLSLVWNITASDYRGDRKKTKVTKSQMRYKTSHKQPGAR